LDLSRYAAPLAPGSVALVGAGPGDVGMLTLAGAALMRQADVVIYDALSNVQLLELAPRAEHIYAGKRAAHHSMTQDEINACLVEHAKQHKRVVRLKGGDPFVFGRGGEECEALLAENIPFVVVPGITAAVAAGAYAGIPVTHRDLNTSFTFITGHEKDRKYQDADAKERAAGPDAAKASGTDWSAVAKLPALAFYMGVKSLPRITEKLLAHGMNPQTPAATVMWGTTAKQRSVVGTVETIADVCENAGITAPAITYVGAIAGLRDQLAWFEKRPLHGRRILVTRSVRQSGSLASKLAAKGAEVLEVPAIRIEPPADDQAIRPYLNRLHEGGYDWLILTSANGVERAREAMRLFDFDSRSLAGVQVAAVGPATAAACRELLNVTPNLLPGNYDGDGLVAALASDDNIAGNRFLLLRADIADPATADKLRDAGAATVDDVAGQRRCDDHFTALVARELIDEHGLA
ncbi:MAG: uroporphyrinogen-III C-methyltransferase, partial [Planctomycetota bacterium]